MQTVGSGQRKFQTGRWGKFCLSSPLFFLPSFLFYFCVVDDVVGNPMQGSARGQAALGQNFTLPLTPSLMHMLFFFNSWDRISVSCLGRPWTWDTPASASKVPGNKGLYHQYQPKLNLNRIFCDLYIKTHCMVSPLHFCHKHTKSYKSLKSSNKTAASYQSLNVHSFPSFPLCNSFCSKRSLLPGVVAHISNPSRERGFDFEFHVSHGHRDTLTQKIIKNKIDLLIKFFKEKLTKGRGWNLIFTGTWVQTTALQKW